MYSPWYVKMAPALFAKLTHLRLGSRGQGAPRAARAPEDSGGVRGGYQKVVDTTPIVDVPYSHIVIRFIYVL